MNVHKQKIIELFNKNVKGQRPDTTNSNQRHDGKVGHWLEKQMGVTHIGHQMNIYFNMEDQKNIILQIRILI